MFAFVRVTPICEMETFITILIVSREMKPKCDFILLKINHIIYDFKSISKCS